MARIIEDPESVSLQQHFAVVHSPRKSRKRFAESCVMVYEEMKEALANASESDKRHAAIVYGPSISSESQRIYYLVRWL